MTTINYLIGSHMGNQTTVDTYVQAQTTRQQIMEQEIAQLDWWPIICHVTNNDGSTTMCPIDSNGNPVMQDANGNMVPYVDNTIAPSTPT